MKTYKLKDRIISFITAVIMVITLIPLQPITAYAEDTPEVLWGTAADALTNSGTWAELSDILNTEQGNTSISYVKANKSNVTVICDLPVYKEMTVDIAGHNLYLTSAGFISAKTPGVTITVLDSAETDGTLKITGTRIIFIEGTLNIEGGKFINDLESGTVITSGGASTCVNLSQHPDPEGITINYLMMELSQDDFNNQFKLPDGYAWFDSENKAVTAMKPYGVYTVGKSAAGITYNVTVNYTIGGGNVTAQPSAATAGTPVTITVSPYNNRELVSLTVKQGDTEIPVTDNQFIMPAGDVVIYPEFRIINPTIEVTAADGTVTLTDTFWEAMAAVENSTSLDTVVKLLDNITIPSREHEISKGVFTFNLNGKTINGGGAEAALDFGEDTKVVITGGGAVENAVSAIKTKSDALIIENGSFNGADYAISITGGNTAINNGIFATTDTNGGETAVNATGGNTVIVDGSFTGFASGLAVREAIVDIRGGSFEAATAIDVFSNGSVSISGSAALNGEFNDIINSFGEPVIVTSPVTGPTPILLNTAVLGDVVVKGAQDVTLDPDWFASADPARIVAYNRADNAISLIVCTHTPDIHGKCTTYGCDYSYEAKITHTYRDTENATYFDSLAQAIDRAGTDSRVYLLKDATLSESISKDVPFTLFAAGNTLTVADGKSINMVKGFSVYDEDNTVSFSQPGKIVGNTEGALLRVTGGTVPEDSFIMATDVSCSFYYATIINENPAGYAVSTDQGYSRFYHADVTGGKADLYFESADCVLIFSDLIENKKYTIAYAEGVDPTGKTIARTFETTNAPISKDMFRVISPAGYTAAEMYDEITGDVTGVYLQKNLTADMISVAEGSVYNGSRHKPAVTVTDGGKTLTEGTDYTVEYSNNIKPTTETSKATVTVTGKGNYTGTVDKTFEISKAEVTADMFSLTYPDNLIYNGNTKIVTATVKDGFTGVGSILVKYYDENGDLVPQAVNAGKYTVKLSVGEGENYTATQESIFPTEGGVSWSFEITKATYDMSNVKWNRTSDQPFEFDGTAHTVELTGLPQGVTASYTDNSKTAVGSYVAKAELSYDSVNYNAPSAIEQLEWIIEWNVTENKDYTINSAGTPNSAGWYNSTVTISPAAGCLISTSKDGTYGDNLTLSEDTADGSVTFWLKDIATGSVSDEETVTYKLDATAPAGTVTMEENSWTAFLNSITFNKFFNETVDVKVNATDATSGVKSVEYIESHEVLTLEEVKQIANWTAMGTDNKVSVTAKDAKQFVYYIRITDNADNVTIISTSGATFDLKAPVISGITNGATYYTTQKFTVTESNLADVKVNDNAVTEYTLAGNVEATYKVVATDKAGNSTTVTVTMKPISTLAEDMEDVSAEDITAVVIENLENIKELLENAVNSEATTATEKAEVQGVLDKISTIADGITIDYKIIHGADSSWTQGSSSTMGFTSDGLFSQFKEVRVGGKVLVKDTDYIAVSGSTIVTLRKSYLDTLSAGKYKLEVVYDILGEEHIADCEFTINTKPSPTTQATPTPTDNVPKTGDTTHTVGWMSLILSSMAALAVVLKKKRKYESR